MAVGTLKVFNPKASEDSQDEENQASLSYKTALVVLRERMIITRSRQLCGFCLYKCEIIPNIATKVTLSIKFSHAGHQAIYFMKYSVL